MTKIVTNFLTGLIFNLDENHLKNLLNFSRTLFELDYRIKFNYECDYNTFCERNFLSQRSIPVQSNTQIEHVHSAL